MSVERVNQLLRDAHMHLDYARRHLEDAKAHHRDSHAITAALNAATEATAQVERAHQDANEDAA